MHNRQRTWIWLAAAFSFVMGFILVLNDNGAGWFLIIIGISYLGISTRAGQTWAASNPNLVRWGSLEFHYCSSSSSSLLAQSSW